MSLRCARILVIGGMCIAAMSWAVPARAQRGGGGGGRSMGGSPEGRGSKTQFDDKSLGVRFAVPPGLDLFTPSAPGRYRSAFTERKIALLVNPRQVEDTISVKYADGMTAADLKAYQVVLESNPPQAKLPGYEKVSITAGKVGKEVAEESVDFIYRATQNGEALTYRQVVFVHGGRGFTVACATRTKDFGTANREWFDSLLKHLELY